MVIKHGVHNKDTRDNKISDLFPQPVFITIAYYYDCANRAFLLARL